MPQVFESADSPSASVSENQTGSSARKRYTVLETTSFNTAESLVRAIAPLALTVNGEVLIRQTIDLDPEGHDTWFAKVKYGPEDSKKSQEQPEPGVWRFSFDTSGGTHNLKQAIEEVWRGERSATNPAPDLQGAIGYDGKDVKGVDVPVPLLRFNIIAYYDAEAVTTEFVSNLARATGKTNSEPWLNFEECELLFMGASGEGDIPTTNGQRVKPIPVTLKFDASENRTDIEVGEITVPSKKGWEHLDVRYEELEDAGVVVKVPVHARVQKIFYDIDFADIFGFGGEPEP